MRALTLVASALAAAPALLAQSSDHGAQYRRTLGLDPRFGASEAALCVPFATSIAPIDSTPGAGGGGSGHGRPAGGSWRGPGDTVPSGTPSTPSGGSAPSSAPSPGGNPKAPTPGAAGGGGPSSGTSMTGPMPSAPKLAMELDDSWWLWWEYNKADFLRPNRLGMWRLNATGDDAAEAWRAFLASTRHELSTQFSQRLADPDATVRRAAVDALAKFGGERAVPEILKMLADQSLEVRHHAILALGSSAAPEALAPLRSLARHGSLREEQERVSPIAPAVAIVALALGRRNGFDEEVDQFVAERLRERAKSEREPLGCAAMLYQRLAPCAQLEAAALRLAADADEAPSVRCRAIEALSSSKDPAVLTLLQALVRDGRIDERRSAALALGALENTLALAALTAAAGHENEPLTRGFLLVSIGRRGDPAAREFLTRALASASAGERPWAALALGLHARSDAEPALRNALREALKAEKNRASHGAYWLALGLARDLGARSLLRDALVSGADARQRMYASTALALIGDEDSALVLRERVQVEDNPFLRATFAGALGLFGQERDAGVLGDAIGRLKDPELQGLTATALALHGTRPALQSLRTHAADADAPGARRAAAIEGLSMMLGRSAPYTFTEISRQANYTVFNDWTKGMLQVSL